MDRLVSLGEHLDDVTPVWRLFGVAALTVGGVTIASQVQHYLQVYRASKGRAAFRKQNQRHKDEFAQEIRKKLPGSSHEQICSLSVEELQKALQEGRYTATQVLHAFQRKAVDLTETVNCVAMYVTEANEMARQLDAAPRKRPLHGIPISIKEMHPLKGYANTLGNYLKITKKRDASFAVIEVLQKQGAVPFVLTNMPNTAWSYNSWNSLYGDFYNPHDVSRHAGGSSGGEAAIVAGGASVLGFGSDLGGSVRLPAAWCGIVGLKCGSTRLSQKNMDQIDGLSNILPVGFGPMTRDVDSAAFLMRHLLVADMFDNDPITPPVPWREEIYQDRMPLRIGYNVDNKILRPVPAIERAVHTAKDRLQTLGHTLVPFELPEMSDTTWYDLYQGVFGGDGCASFLEAIVGDDVYSGYANFQAPLFPRLPRWFNLILAKVVKLFDKRNGKFLEYGCSLSSVYSWWKLVGKVNLYRQLCAEKMLTEGVDAILCPVTATPAMLHKHFTTVQEIASYNCIYNLLDWPAGVVQVTKVTDADVVAMKDYPTRGLYTREIHETMQGSQGLPLNVQVATLPYREELCLSILKQLENASK